MSVKCTECGKTWADDTEKCPYCGAVIEKEPTIEYEYVHKEKDYKLITSIVCNAILVVVVIILASSLSKQKPKITSYKDRISTLETENQRAQDKYDKLLEQNKKLTENESDNTNDNGNIAKVKEYYKDYKNWSFAEVGSETHKSLIISYYEPIENLKNDNSEVAENAGALMAQMSKEPWFDYDYVFWDMWSDEVGKLSSLVFDVSEGMNVCQQYTWYSSSNETQASQQETDSSNNLLYEDDKVKISFGGINEKGVVFWLENLTDINITVQADSIAINGISTSSIVMSDDVAPKSIGKVVARCDDFSTVSKVETVSGQLKIIDFKSYDSYTATFTNIEVN